MALAYLKDAFGAGLPRVRALEKIRTDKRRLILRLMEAGMNSPPTSSCGRLFDAVSFIAGVAPSEVEFEAEAPMRLEALASDPTRTAYAFGLDSKSSPWQLSFAATIRGVVSDLSRKTPVARIASRFHNTLGRAIAAVAEKAREEFGIKTVVLVGGVFLNKRLLRSASALLADKGFSVVRPVRYSPNDESISLGQIAFGLAWLKKRGLSS
jgi:hydrogenase maturation protein HypF